MDERDGTWLACLAREWLLARLATGLSVATRPGDAKHWGTAGLPAGCFGLVWEVPSSLIFAPMLVNAQSEASIDPGEGITPA